MEIPRAFCLSVLIVCVFAAQAGGQEGFLSLDCGSQEERYTDDKGILYLQDGSLEQKIAGKAANISFDFLTPKLERPLRRLRFFPEGTRNCYALPAREGLDVAYLTRATFYYGDYDGQEQPPTFDLYLGVYKWATINFTRSNETVMKEIVHFPPMDEIDVCLVNTGKGVPFISALELRALPGNAYRSNYEYLKLFRRIDFGSKNQSIVRYPDDHFDRLWDPPSPSNVTSLTSNEVDTLSRGDYRLPPKVMKTAIKPANENTTFLKFNWSPEIKDCLFFIHIAEVEDITGGREFTISANNDFLDTVQSPERLEAPLTWENPVKFSEPNLTVVLNRTERSENPPILNAVEIFMVENVTGQPTKQQEVAAMKSIRKFFQIKDVSWQGDPCAPRIRKNWWTGVGCASDSPNIISVNLSSRGLHGRIHPSFMNLSDVEVLDLSNNRIDGEIPAFFSEMRSLRVLNISKNNLKGEIPQALIDKSNNRSLNFSYDDNSGLCLPGSCKKKSSIVPIIAAIGAVVVLAVLLLVICTVWKLKRRKRETAIPPFSSSSKPVGQEEAAAPFGSRNRRFTHSEIERITNNFNRVLGRGGFGIVYYGKLEDNTEVAVKMLSANSLQGSEEFRAEANLLMTVHHKNLTSLVGYCDEGTNKGLIYEYMPNGNLQRLLQDSRVDALSWDERFRVAIDAAQGLEYLHNGIRPPVIHRDIKTSNILLDANFNSKLADFGLSKAFEIGSDTGGISTQIRGTPGYLDPEYYISKRLTKKSDIYSFGVVLLELMTGKPAIIREEAENMHVSEWVKKEMARGGISSVVDLRLNGVYSPTSAQKAVDIGLACASTDVNARPDVGDVVAELKECLKMEVVGLNSRCTESGEESSGGVLSTGEFQSIVIGR